MNIENLLWTEIQEIKEAISKHKEKQWDFLKTRIIKGVTFEQIKKLREAFDAERNRFIIEGRCNRILDEIQRQDLKIQKELKGEQE